MSLISEFKEIGSFLQKVGNIELYNKHIAIQEKAVEIMDANRDLREQIDRLKEKLKIKVALIFKDNAYYSIDSQGKIIDGPFCSGCWDEKEKLIQLHQKEKSQVYTEEGKKPKKAMWCPDCKTFGGPK